MKELKPTIYDDYEHRVNQLIELHGDEEGFPQMETFQVTRSQLDDYLFDYQSILDSEGTARSQQTLYGILVVLPVVVTSLIDTSVLPWRSATVTLLAAVGVGLLLAGVVKGLLLMRSKHRVTALRRTHVQAAAYADAVTAYRA